MKGLNLRKRSSGMALAIALATGAVVATGSFGFAEPAHAQKKKKKKEKEEKASYSEEFIAAYTPLNDALNAEGTDLAPLKPQLTALASLSTSPDEQIASGGLIYNAGAKLSDRALQLEGLQLMLASGKAPADQIGRYNYIAYTLAGNMEQWEQARGFLQSAIDANFTTEGVTAADLQISLAESYFSEERYKEGLAYLSQAIEAREQAGQPVDERWYRRGLTVAYTNEIVPEVYDFTYGWVADYPSAENWRDAINITRNLNAYEDQEILDLLRFSKKVDALTDKQDYIIYVDAADARRLPQEVKSLIEQAYASGTIGQEDTFIAESLSTASGRLAGDRRDLPSLEADASASGAALRTVVAAGDAFYSYGEYEKAAGFYERSLTMPGVDTARVLTRLGMSQIQMGQYDTAKATLAKVSGARMPIARLWSTYADQQTSGAASAATVAETTVGG
ncbi:MAG: hypothetical protein AAF250_01185 [Pseudomonadota bacterium]